ncbi:MAG TPA: DUF4287 domain-containing protein [Acidimicrobiales bacterium]|jgi:hypothetical protein|nr:DUF4287 domain-containing protein [Acidimicrobiales bacterium]
MAATRTATPKGPESYFPSIEARYGRPIAEWKQVIRDSGLTTWKELMALLKGEHGMGHGHANALVLHTLKEGTPPT